MTDPLNQVTEYTYDDRDNLVALKDAKANTTTFQYDRNNRLVKETRPLGEQSSYEYDQVGNLARKVDAKQQKTEYGYDDAGRLREIRYYAAAVKIGDVRDLLTFLSATDTLSLWLGKHA